MRLFAVILLATGIAAAGFVLADDPPLDARARAALALALAVPQELRPPLIELEFPEQPKVKKARGIAPPGQILNPDLHTRQAVEYLRGMPEYDRQYTRFLSWHAVPEETLEDFQTVARWWLNQLSTSQDLARPTPISDRLWAIDLRDFRWNAQAWRAVALREPYFRFPAVGNNPSAELRELIHEEPDNKNYHAVGIVRADWLFRETIESNRSSSYYDLLFAEKRFGDQVYRTETRTVYHAGGDYHYPDDSRRVSYGVASGNYQVELKFRDNKAAFVDFPKNEDDWNDFFGVKNVTDFLRKQKINVEHGAVVAGSRDDPVRGSIVARNNRLVFVLPVPTGVALKTFDTDKTAGGQDYSEKHAELVVGKIQFKAGELLASLPNGGQAGLLIDAKGKRIELASTEFAHNKADARYVDVRTMHGCVTCHAPHDGFIPPRDLTAEMFKAGVNLKVKDRDLKNRVKAFFLEWDEQIAGYQSPYRKLVQRTTRTTANPKGWTGGQLVSKFLAARNWYDDPLSPEQVAIEMGVPVAVAKLMGSRSPNARANLITQGRDTPRDAFEEVFRELSLLLEVYRKELP